MNLMKKLLPVALCGVLLVCGGCGKQEEAYTPYDYDATHDSADSVLRFFSSDNSLDAFLNEFFERHMRNNPDLRIHTFPIGAAQPIWKEWESMIGSFWDSSSKTLDPYYATNDWVKNWLKLDYMSVQDRQGYISTSTGVTSTDWGQGWAFPNYHSNRVSPFGEEFTKGANGWTGDAGTKVSAETSNEFNVAETLDGKAEHVLRAETDGAADELTVLSPELAAGKFLTHAFYSPFLNFSWKYDVTGGLENVEDLYVYFQTEDDPTWTKEKRMSYSEYASRTLSMAAGNNIWQGTFLPMFLNPAWGRDAVDMTKITRLKFSLQAKPGKTFTGTMSFNFIRADFDDRLPDNCGEYIVAAKNYLSYAQDKDLLETVLPIARRAMQYYLTCLDGESGLVSTEYLVGHFCTGDADTGIGIGNGFWDAISFPKVNFYTNITYYQALKSMLYLERMAANYNLDSEAVSILGKDMKTEVRYRETAATLQTKLDTCRTKMQQTFWDKETGRFFAGYYDQNDGLGTTDRKMDYGFLLFNLQAVTDGIASDEQAASILSWVNGDRAIAGDTSQKEDIYKYLFAPRFSTKHNGTDGVWAVGQASYWEVGVRDGGAVMQTSYYDIAARGAVLGADNAFARLKGIQDFYERVKATGGSGQAFYRAYFEQLGIGMQGNYDTDGDGLGNGDQEGPIGIDCEFLEAALMFVSIPDVFFGLQPDYDGTLQIAPSMPAGLDYWRLENLSFGDNAYDCSIGKYFVQLSNINGAPAGLQAKICLRKPNFDYQVFYNGQRVTAAEENGRLVVTVPFANGKVEVKKA